MTPSGEDFFVIDMYSFPLFPLFVRLFFLSSYLLTIVERGVRGHGYPSIASSITSPFGLTNLNRRGLASVKPFTIWL